jgi:hypothetical protein
VTHHRSPPKLVREGVTQVSCSWVIAINIREGKEDFVKEKGFDITVFAEKFKEKVAQKVAFDTCVNL